MTQPAAPPSVTPRSALVALGAACVVIGGFVAAFTGPLDLTKGSWVAAYLVLVLGVGQYVMGRARAGTSADPAGWIQLGGWNLGSLLVIGGTLVETPLVVDLGSLCLVVALALALRSDLRAAPDRLDRARRIGYRAVLVLLLVSIPVGMFLSHARHG